MPFGNGRISIHVDVDDLWAVAGCYGISMGDAGGIPSRWAHHLVRDGIPRALELFAELGVRATFFVVGRDLEGAESTEILKQAVSAGHTIGNHSYSHSLAFRNLDASEIESEIRRCDALCRDRLGVIPAGFRAPGYGWSRKLMNVLGQVGYHHDSSLMPSFAGPAFRLVDRRLTRRVARMAGLNNRSDHLKKTQYPRLTDWFHPVHSFPVQVPGGTVEEHPVAASPFLRLPMQAGVCMNLGSGYFRFQYQLVRRASPVPRIFLFHAADFADFSPVPHPFFREGRFFSCPVESRIALARHYIQAWRESPGLSDETWG